LASGVAALHQNSDLDLIVRTPRFVSRDWAVELVQVLDRSVCRIDVQLQTPFGALALREWAGASRQVLLKSELGVWLVTQPWQPTQACA
ncbi:MAG: phosphoribosyl-dephospho-CoA transferase MdcG domain-containing protein, partial [Pseudomonas caspiana]